MKLNLGCGPKWKELYPDYKGLDIIDYGQEYVGDVMSILSHFENNTLTEVMANHFLEHFDQSELRNIFYAVNRCLKRKGIFKFTIPHKKTKSAWILSHKTFWNEETVKWLEREEANKVYGFGKWKVIEIVTNKRGDIHARLRKI